jgi:hypothetical protein
MSQLTAWPKSYTNLKDGKATKTFEALDWLAQLVTHIPNKGESAGGGPEFSIPS